MEPQESSIRWDGLLAELQDCRERQGLSYAGLARRIQAARRAAGKSDHAAHVAVSTVHYAFRLGRSRINMGLTREIAMALGAEAVFARHLDGPSTPSPDPLQTVKPDPPADTIPAPAPAPALVDEQPNSPAWLPLLLMAAGLILNLFGRAFVDYFGLPIHLDMVGTALTAVALGPWRGAATGLATNVVGVIGSGWVSLPFAVVNVAGALAWGYGVKHGWGASLARFFALCLAVGVLCSVLALPILAGLESAHLWHFKNLLAEGLRESIPEPSLALAFSNLLASLGDKAVSGFAALALACSLPAFLRQAGPLLTHPVINETVVQARSRQAM